MISQFLLIIPMPTVDKRIWTSDPSLRRRMLYPAELCRHTIFGLKSRFFSLFDHPDRWPIFSIFSRYFFRRKCYLRPLQHLAFLIKILSTELPSTPEYFSKVLSTGPPLGGLFPAVNHCHLETPWVKEYQAFPQCSNPFRSVSVSLCKPWIIRKY